MARGELVARMDRDDESLPERFEIQLAVVDRNPDYGVVACHLLNVDVQGRPVRLIDVYPRDFDEFLAAMKTLPVMAHPGAMISLAAFERVGGYRDVYRQVGVGRHWRRYWQWRRYRLVGCDAPHRTMRPTTLLHGTGSSPPYAGYAHWATRFPLVVGLAATMRLMGENAFADRHRLDLIRPAADRGPCVGDADRRRTCRMDRDDPASHDARGHGQGYNGILRPDRSHVPVAGHSVGW